jgi:hypothetical protein
MCRDPDLEVDPDPEVDPVKGRNHLHAFIEILQLLLPKNVKLVMRPKQFLQVDLSNAPS